MLGGLGIYNSLPTLTPNLRTERPSNWSSAQLKDGYVNLLLHSKNVVKWGWVGRQIRLKKTVGVFFFQSLT